MPKIFTSKTQKTGKIGENMAVKFLMKRGYAVLERNYTKPWGEIDIIATKSKKLHFIEVKSVTVTTISARYGRGSFFTKNWYDPEENMHYEKRRCLAKTIQTYFAERKIWASQEWQIDLFVVFIDLPNKKAAVKVVKDIIL